MEGSLSFKPTPQTLVGLVKRVLEGYYKGLGFLQKGSRRVLCSGLRLFRVQGESVAALQTTSPIVCTISVCIRVGFRVWGLVLHAKVSKA